MDVRPKIQYFYRFRTRFHRVGMLVAGEGSRALVGFASAGQQHLMISGFEFTIRNYMLQCTKLRVPKFKFKY
jgi:hypothetical protein